MLTKIHIPLERQLKNARQRERTLKRKLAAALQKLDQALFAREGALSLAELQRAQLKQLGQAALEGPVHTWVPQHPRGGKRQVDIRAIAAVQACLHLGPDASIADVARYTGRSSSTAWEWIHRAIEAGWLSADGEGKKACLNITAVASQRIPALRARHKQET